ncbi:MAG TPA: T9SS type A sorting domain-containing protein, partial [Bacteroidia bacterium]|nr:T9SS type A sorting domain-containing protein [Bacteroidia bacterium]
GRSETFDPIKVHACSDRDVIDVYVSSKTRGNSNAYLNSPYTGIFTLEVYSSSGSIVESRVVHVEKGLNTLVLNTGKLSEGIYYLRLQSTADQLMQKFFVGQE